MAATTGSVEERAAGAAHLIRERTGHRWVGIYRVTDTDVRNLAWSGPAGPAYPNFPIEQGLTGAAIRSAASVLSNDVANDPRYLTNQTTTGSELIVPILADGQVVGTLDVEDATTNAFDENGQVRFEEIATALVELFARVS